MTKYNLEKVWKAEQSAEKEKSKLDQLRKEKQQERELEELQNLHDQNSNEKYYLIFCFNFDIELTAFFIERNQKNLIGCTPGLQLPRLLEWLKSICSEKDAWIRF